ncbi:voltage-dependent L-type calcium channel subunit beta-3-like [Corticium candelabrum]|uniref:voltage-dependent L-type calcium channel subunit beta-3-like n=1 Tax=Corticium candelabrum TaxID=121492 RepID=UPI002E273AF3|nr:voltage-dependent L-type calcium channel subunit beta-3-like [Corticium candelabrum]
MSSLRRCSSCADGNWLEAIAFNHSSISESRRKLTYDSGPRQRFWKSLWKLPLSKSASLGHLSMLSAEWKRNSGTDADSSAENPVDERSEDCDSFRASVVTRETLIQQAKHLLKEAKTCEVVFVMRACASYDGSRDEDCLVRGQTLSISVNDFLQIKKKLNDDWWIGRVVKEGGNDGLIPSPKKLEKKYLQQIHGLTRNRKKGMTGSLSREGLLLDPTSERHTRRLPEERTASDGHESPELSKGYNNSLPVQQPAVNQRRRMTVTQLFKKSEPEPVRAYDIVPHMRPILFVGPSLKGFDVTDLMQEAVIECLKIHFKDRGRLRTLPVFSRHAAAYKPGQNSKISSQGVLAEIRSCVREVYDQAKTMNLLLLETNVSYPTDFIKAGLAPLVICIRINSVRVLKRLILSRGKTQEKRLGDQLASAEKLAQMNPATFDLIIDENQLEEACDKLIAFLELQWRATRPNPSVTPTTKKLKTGLPHHRFHYKRRGQHTDSYYSTKGVSSPVARTLGVSSRESEEESGASQLSFSDST